MSTNEEQLIFNNLFKSYQKVPNVPFLTSFTSSFVKKFFIKNKIKFTENNYSIICKVPSKNNGGRKMVIISHLDHPAFILKNSKEGVLMGLVGTSSLNKTISENQICIKVYGPKGEYKGIANVTDVSDDPKQRVKIKASFMIEKNSFGHFNLKPFEETTDTYKVYNADDGVMVCVLLDLISRKIESDYDILFVFTKHEEVHQVSSWNLAKYNHLDISEKDLIVNLECLKVESINENKYGKISYEKGPVLQLSNTGCLFGYKNKGKNLAEILVRNVAKKNNMNIQIGLIKDSCDSRPFTQFALTPNICTLTIPNKYKHNGADDGNIRTEEIYKKDVKATQLLLTEMIKSDSNNLDILDTESMSKKIKGSDNITNHKLMYEKMLINERIEVAYKDIVKRDYYYPISIKDHVLDLTLKALSYLKYFYLKLK